VYAIPDAAEKFVLSWLRPQTRGINEIDDLISLATRAGPSRTANQDRVVYARLQDDGQSLMILYPKLLTTKRRVSNHVATTPC